jgi:hypothetical protein
MMTISNRLLVAAACATLAWMPASLAQESQSTSFVEAVKSGEGHFMFRYRYEFVDQDFNVVTGDPFVNDAHASTMLVRLNYRTGKWNDWSMFGEFDYVGELFFRDFNNTVDPNRNQYPVVADPWGSDLNQLYLDYDGLKESNVRLGRRRIVLDNQRFVGGVAWRQNEQTFDSVSGTFKGMPNTELFASYVRQVNRIFGERSTAGKALHKTLLLNAKIKMGESWQVVPYGYYLNDERVTGFDTSTFGLRLSGKIPAGGGNIALVGEYAYQSDAADNPVSYNANYYHLDALWTLKNGLSFGIGGESLGGDDQRSGAAFRTPLATLHLFQGWADQFLATPSEGIDDLYAKIGYKSGNWTLLAVYHDFTAQSGSLSFGTEFDASVQRKLGDRYSLLLKGAWFSADSVVNASRRFSDVTKFWLMLTANY